jgi:hypothetical protein
MKPDDLAGVIIAAAFIILFAALAKIWREWQRREWEHIYQQRETELRDQDAFIQTIGVGPKLVVTHRKNSENHNGEKEGAVHK